jgi:trehalose 6-phosphate synthase/phosphatase
VTKTQLAMKRNVSMPMERQAAWRRLTLLLDYDGTLVPIVATPDLARPDAALLALLAELAADPETDLHMVSGRSIADLQQWFSHLNATLWAEHGAACRPAGASTWERRVGSEAEWLRRAEGFLDAVCARMPGTLVEQKATSVAWHYRTATPALTDIELGDIRRRLADALDGAPAEVVDGRMVIEVRPRGVSKAAVARDLSCRAAAGRRIVAIGDDQTDEEMFAALPRSAITMRVGSSDTIARFRLRDPGAVREFLRRLVTARRKRSCRGAPEPPGRFAGGDR